MSWVTTRRKARSQYSTIEEFERQQQASMAAAELADRSAEQHTASRRTTASHSSEAASAASAQLHMRPGGEDRVGQGTHDGHGGWTSEESGTTRQEPDGSFGPVARGKRMPRQRADAAHPWPAEPAVHAEQAMKQAFSIPEASSKQVTSRSHTSSTHMHLHYSKDDACLEPLA